jgi:hypothetical protein
MNSEEFAAHSDALGEEMTGECVEQRGCRAAGVSSSGGVEQRGYRAAGVSSSRGLRPAPAAATPRVSTPRWPPSPHGGESGGPGQRGVAPSAPEPGHPTPGPALPTPRGATRPGQPNILFSQTQGSWDIGIFPGKSFANVPGPRSRLGRPASARSSDSGHACRRTPFRRRWPRPFSPPSPRARRAPSRARSSAWARSGARSWFRRARRAEHPLLLVLHVETERGQRTIPPPNDA